MPQTPRRRLTSDLARRAFRPIPDEGPLPGITLMTEQDYDDLTEALLAEAPAGDLWIFAYGSLIWRPAFPPAEQRRARLDGWHRSFVIELVRFRGTPDCPGLMMSLIPGGVCEGVIQRLPRSEAREGLGLLVRREISTTPPTNKLMWIEARSEAGSVPAIAITADPAGRYFREPRSHEETAAILARACGHVGSCADYLHQTCESLEALGIEDESLLHLQHLVAEHLDRR